MSLLHATPVRAQSSDAEDGYRIGENTSAVSNEQDNTQPPAASQSINPSKQGPVRMVRFSYLHGNVTWRAADGMEWTKATLNMPIQQGAQIWVTNGGRADLQFDDGSELRLGNGALATLKLLYSDAQGEFSQITITDGLATLYARHDVSVYQIDTPLVSIKSKGLSQIRFGVDGGGEVAVQRGGASLEGPQGKVALHEGDYLDLANGDAAYAPHKLPTADSWDQWNADRDRLIETRSETDRHVPPNIGLVAGDLDAYGTWHDDPKNGWVWTPQVSSEDWRPYHDGHWAWVDPYGWTWVGDEPWGWAPYHYGTWIDEPYGWAWCPGPVSQYWSPGVVDFSVSNGNVCWVPLCPWEVSYPAACSVGCWGDAWCLSFSIGWAGCYYPGGFGFCVGRPWDNFYVNHWDRFGHDRFGEGRFGHDQFGHDHNALAGNHGFVPYNARNAAGATVASTAAFGGRGSYGTVPRGETTAFTHGQSVVMPAAGRSPLSGPALVQPTQSHSFAATAHPSSAVQERSVYHGSLPNSVQRSLPASQSQSGSGGPSAAQQARAGITRMGTPYESRTAVNSGIASGANDRNSAAEAARQARASLGIRRTSSSGYVQGGGRYGNADRTYSSGRSGYSSLSPGPRYGQSYGAEHGSSYHNNGSYSGRYSGGNSGGFNRGGSFGGYRSGGFGGGSHSGFGGGSHGGGGRGR